MGTMNRRYRVPDMDKLTLSPEALAALPEVADFLEETGKDLKYKADREGFAHAAEQLRIEHAEPTGDYLARVAAGKTPGDLRDEVPAAVERVRLLVEEFEARGARYMNPGSPGDELAVADLRAVLRELRRARALAVDPTRAWIVTVKLPKQPEHDPRNKRTGPCRFSDECTDVTGEHHSFLTGADGIKQLKQDGAHITRTERLGRSPGFLRE